jgi:hypothetical protein
LDGDEAVLHHGNPALHRQQTRVAQQRIRLCDAESPCARGRSVRNSVGGNRVRAVMRRFRAGAAHADSS